MVSNYGAAVRNNAGGYYNHNLFWACMTPGGGGEPQGALAGEIDRAFGSADKFREELSAAGINRFGSGFAWLIVQNRQLKIVSTPNQDNPLMDVVAESCRGAPVLALDVWEHAYYLKYQNRRPDYIKAWWNTVDWKKSNERFEAAMG
jgi:Fe-Mn family superoxide dismutase